MYQTVIANGTIVNHDGRRHADVAISDGKIAEIGEPGSLQGERVIDANGKFVAPGAIDPHVHLGLYTDLESDFRTETRSAAVGGVTMFKHMLINQGSYHDTFEATKRLGETNSMVDFAFDVAMVHDTHVPEVAEYNELGINSYKFLLAYKGSEGAELGIRSCDDGYLYHGMKEVAKLGFPANVRVHCENFDIIVTLRDKLRESGADGLKAWMDARPRITEATDVVRAAYLAGQLGCRIAVIHISSAESVDAIQLFKDQGVDILGETGPQWLYFTYESDIGILGKYNPSLKDQESVDRLWRGLKERTMTSIGTDHAWSSLEAKKADGTIWNALLGFTGVGTMLPFMLSEGLGKGRLSLEEVVAVTSYNTAKWYGFHPRKGEIAVGADADVNVLDLDLTKPVRAADLHAGADWTPFEGVEFTGWPVLTMVRGAVVAENGKPVGDGGNGRFVPGGTASVEQVQRA